MRKVYLISAFGGEVRAGGPILAVLSEMHDKDKVFFTLCSESEEQVLIDLGMVNPNAGFEPALSASVDVSDVPQPADDVKPKTKKSKSGVEEDFRPRDLEIYYCRSHKRNHRKGDKFFDGCLDANLLK